MLSFNKFYDDRLDKLFDKFMMDAEITCLRNIVIEQSNKINDLTVHKKSNQFYSKWSIIIKNVNNLHYPHF